jgi:hypothetical protein
MMMSVVVLMAISSDIFCVFSRQILLCLTGSILSQGHDAILDPMPSYFMVITSLS